VALTVRHHFACDDEVALLSSILHDTIEDTTTDYEDIESKFGEAVANCVACLTKNMALPEHQRESQYDAQLAHGPWQARLVKLADAFDNLCDLDSLITPDRERVTRDSFERARRALTLCELDTGETFERARAALIALLDQLR
jgi:guanosine-3',5'-bis(diphosphate) 3'-pyrophosphohydrolase